MYWVKNFIRFHGLKHPRDMGQVEIESFLTYLATQRKVSVCTWLHGAVMVHSCLHPDPDQHGQGRHQGAARWNSCATSATRASTGCTARTPDTLWPGGIGVRFQLIQLQLHFSSPSMAAAPYGPQCQSESPMGKLWTSQSGSLREQQTGQSSGGRVPMPTRLPVFPSSRFAGVLVPLPVFAATIRLPLNFEPPIPVSAFHVQLPSPSRHHRRCQNHRRNSRRLLASCVQKPHARGRPEKNLG
ncbi:MAG: phage integrase N-terminal SAM-like domain-containing protein [Polaromonas sp.]|nr:phage integrase N-terminal SAM-like domain-containing protein [Polaromonas sp.]